MSKGAIFSRKITLYNLAGTVTKAAKIFGFYSILVFAPSCITEVCHIFCDVTNPPEFKPHNKKKGKKKMIPSANLLPNFPKKVFRIRRAWSHAAKISVYSRL